MSAYGHTALQQAIHAALSNDSALMAIVTGVYDYVPQSSVFPYVWISGLQGKDYSDAAGPRMQWSIGIEALSREAGQAEAVRIMERVHAVLHHAPLSVSGQTLIYLKYMKSEIELLKDGVTYCGQMQFVAITKPI